MTPAEARDILFTMGKMTEAQARDVLLTMNGGQIAALREAWFWQAHKGQREPDRAADGTPLWRIWAIIAGRGFGKTRAGAEWVWARARENPGARIALVGASMDEVTRVMVEGESGLLSVARTGEDVQWSPTNGVLRFPDGAIAFAYGAARPDKLRGPQHHFAWADELAKWGAGETVWDDLMMGMRLGERPRTIVTTTPRATPLMHRVLALPGIAITRGRTDDNPHLPADFVTSMRASYGGTRLGQQELDGVLFDDVDGALWTKELLDRDRGAAVQPGELDLGTRRGIWVRTVLGLDPPATASGDACGIVVCGQDRDNVLHVLADHSIAGLSPEGWASRVSEVAELWQVERIIAESNQGGDMIRSVLDNVGCESWIELVSATKGKAMRAIPVALRFETGEARMAGRFDALERELVGFTHGGYVGGGSPDRADACIWAMTALMRSRGTPRVAGL